MAVNPESLEVLCDRLTIVIDPPKRRVGFSDHQTSSPRKLLFNKGDILYDWLFKRARKIIEQCEGLARPGTIHVADEGIDLRAENSSNP